MFGVIVLCSVLAATVIKQIIIIIVIKHKKIHSLNKHTKPWFGCLLRHPARKWSGPTYSITVFGGLILITSLLGTE